jgi:hypothetical protein
MVPCNSKVGTCVDRGFPLRSAADLNSTFCFLPRTVTQPMTRASKAHTHAQKLSRGDASEDENRDRECPQSACERGRVRRERHTAGESRVPPRDLNAPTDRIADSSTIEPAIDTPETGYPTSSRRSAKTRVSLARTGGSRIGPRRNHVGRRFLSGTARGTTCSTSRGSSRAATPRPTAFPAYSACLTMLAANACRESQWIEAGLGTCRRVERVLLMKPTAHGAPPLPKFHKRFPTHAH